MSKAVEKLIELVEEVMSSHRDAQSSEYNECDKDLCYWCELADEAITTIRSETAAKGADK